MKSNSSEWEAAGKSKLFSSRVPPPSPLHSLAMQFDQSETAAGHNLQQGLAGQLTDVETQLKKKNSREEKTISGLVASAHHLFICVDKQQGAAMRRKKVFGGFWVMGWRASGGRSTRRSLADWSQPTSASSVQTSRRRRRNKWSNQQDSWLKHLIKASVQSIKRRSGTSGCCKMKKQTAVIPDENICRNPMEV